MSEGSPKVQPNSATKQITIARQALMRPESHKFVAPVR